MAGARIGFFHVYPNEEIVVDSGNPEGYVRETAMLLSVLRLAS